MPDRMNFGRPDPTVAADHQRSKRNRRGGPDPIRPCASSGSAGRTWIAGPVEWQFAFPQRLPVPVLAISESQTVTSIVPSWIDCAVYLSAHADDPPFSVVVSGEDELKYPPSGVNASECEFVLHVSRWEPSPDSPEKRKMAHDILSELRAFGYRDAKRIVVRDFNLEDPDITAYIIDKAGGHTFQGCSFSREASPHCTWHLFGQSPLWALRRQVMSRP
jgi:hypothetical protein